MLEFHLRHSRLKESQFWPISAVLDHSELPQAFPISQFLARRGEWIGRMENLITVQRADYQRFDDQDCQDRLMLGANASGPCPLRWRNFWARVGFTFFGRLSPIWYSFGRGREIQNGLMPTILNRG
jgi:hypothetical protein